MSSILPINLQDLLSASGVESARVEFKASWDPETAGVQCLRTICAFANDFQNLNGGYIVIGAAEHEGRAVMPPKGLTPKALEEAQQWLRGRCKTIDPEYQPVLSPEVVEDRHVLVVWAPGSQSRPHQAPESSIKGASRHFYIRLGSDTVKAQGAMLTQLMQLTARVPFDDRRSLQASLHDLRETKVREFLNDIRSGLTEESDARALYRRLRIADPVNGHDVPRNVGLLFFSQDPETWFPGARIEVVQFADDSAGNEQEETIFARRPIQEQLRECLAYLEGLSARRIQKLANRPEAAQAVGFPAPALREALVNAVYHRSYEGVTEPTKVYLYPDRMEIISYPGPVPGIDADHLSGAAPLPPVPARNRRIGELLKELRLAEGRGTGLPKLRRSMSDNGSPPPRFDFDESRTYFRVTLPAHPEYQAISTLLDVARLRAVGDTEAALNRLRDAASRGSAGSAAVAIELVRELVSRGDFDGAEAVYEDKRAADLSEALAPIATIVASSWLDRREEAKAKAWLNRIPELTSVEDAVEAAIQEKRAGRFERAYRYFTRAGKAVDRDVRALHEFAQTKIRLARKARPKKGETWSTHNRLLDEALPMLLRVTQLDAPRTRHAWAWFDIGQVRQARRAPVSEVKKAFQRAVELNPTESRFAQALQELDGAAD